MKTYDEIAARVFARRKEYLDQVRKKKKRARIIVTSASLCAAIILLISVWSSGILSPKEPVSMRGMIRKDNTPTITNPADNALQGSEKSSGETEADNADGKQNADTGEQNVPDGSDVSSYTGSILEIPAITADEIDADRLAAVLYNKGCYTQAAWYESVSFAPLRGKKLGDAAGTLDPAEKVLLPATVAGEVYEVKGYDKDFRVCVVIDDRTLVLERLNGIQLSLGRSLFEARLHITDLLKTAEYETNESWKNNKNDRRVIDEKLLADLTDMMNGAPFIKAPDDIYDTTDQIHLTFAMKDGTILSIRLIRGGYITYPTLSGYAVKADDKTFEKIFEALAGA